MNQWINQSYFRFRQQSPYKK